MKRTTSRATGRIRSRRASSAAGSLPRPKFHHRARDTSAIRPPTHADCDVHHLA